MCGDLPPSRGTEARHAHRRPPLPSTLPTTDMCQGSITQDATNPWEAYRLRFLTTELFDGTQYVRPSDHQLISD